MADYFIPTWGIGISRALVQTQIVLAGTEIAAAEAEASIIRNVMGDLERARETMPPNEYARRWSAIDNLLSDALYKSEEAAGHASMLLRYALAFGILDAFTFDPIRLAGGSEVCLPAGDEWLFQYRHDRHAASADDRVSDHEIRGPGLYRDGEWQRVWLRRDDFVQWLDEQKKPSFLSWLTQINPALPQAEIKSVKPEKIDLSRYSRSEDKVEALIFTVYEGRPAQGTLHPEIVERIKPLAIASGYRWKGDAAVRQQVKKVHRRWRALDAARQQGDSRTTDGGPVDTRLGTSASDPR